MRRLASAAVTLRRARLTSGQRGGVHRQIVPAAGPEHQLGEQRLAGHLAAHRDPATGGVASLHRA